MFCLFYLQVICQLSVSANFKHSIQFNSRTTYNLLRNSNKTVRDFNKLNYRLGASNDHVISRNDFVNKSFSKADIGGPSSPEATSFKAVGSNNLVNLATGDFSYSIPLLDVGGYPVNLFYNAGIGAEQEASWVGLGWNINPGTVSRNMRGVPDDFDGTDQLIQTQNAKPNRTWGGDLGIDLEYVGIKNPKLGVGGSLGFSYNNYLGPALEIGAKVSISLSASESVKSEKSAPSIGLSLGTKLSSRSGMTFSPSLSANLALGDGKSSIGTGLSTSYNSRTGIKEVSVHSEMSYYQDDFQSIDYLSKSNRIGNSSISFAKPSYIPTLRMPMENAYYSGQLELGGAIWGIKIGMSAMGYYVESKVPDESKTVSKSLVGYMYSEKANTNENAVMDFNRLNDAEVTPNTPIISAPQYNYDIFSVQGEGTGGSIRAYRGEIGFMRDNVTCSKDKNLSIGIDVAIPFHYGLNANTVSTPTRVGGWEDGNNRLLQTLRFKPKQNASSFENIYFRNPGELTVTNDEILNRIGRDNLVRFQLGGSNVTPILESALEEFDKNTERPKNSTVSLINSNLQKREKRTQVISMLTAADAAKVGLEKQIRNYRSGNSEFDGSNNIVYDTISRMDNDLRKPHHISEIDVLEQNGMRYVYGLPVYSIKQKDFTFSVKNLPDSNNIVNFYPDEPTLSSRHMENKSTIDGYVQTQETPGYASSFLITGLLSPDYVDVSGNGITEDDLGGAVKFNYSKSENIHKWRTPRNNSISATAISNEAVRTEKKIIRL